MQSIQKTLHFPGSLFLNNYVQIKVSFHLTDKF